jgi:hypothetical protein
VRSWATSSFTLPGVAYLAALHDLQQLEYGAAGEILVILGFNVMLLALRAARSDS